MYPGKFNPWAPQLLGEIFGGPPVGFRDFHPTPEMPAMRALTLFVATLATASAFMAPASFAGLQLRSPAVCSVPHLPPAPLRA